MAAAQRFALSLATPRNSEVLTGTQGAKVTTVRFTSVPAPVQVSFGQGTALWDVEANVDYRPCPAETGGIYITNAIAGGTLVVMVTMEEGAVQGGS